MTERSFDIAIIGGGVIGLSLARALLREKLNVAVIDAGAEIPAATNAAAGMLAPSFESGAGSDALYALAVASLAMWPEFAGALEEETRLSVDYRSDGILGVAFDAAHAKTLKAECSALIERGGDAAYITGDEARRLEPALSGDIIAAIHAKRDAQVDPRKLLNALRVNFEKNEGAIYQGRAKAVATKEDAVIRLANGGRLTAATIVIASGAAVDAVDMDLPPPPVFPVKGEAVSLEMPERTFRKVIRAPGAYLCPKADSRLVIGATEYEGLKDYEVDASAIAALVANGARAVPAIAGYAEQERWAGLRPATPDGAPILGRDSRGPENLILALGHYRNGVLLAPGSAAALRDLILGRAPVTELKPFRPERFEEYAYD